MATLALDSHPVAVPVEDSLWGKTNTAAAGVPPAHWTIAADTAASTALGAFTTEDAEIAETPWNLRNLH